MKKLIWALILMILLTSCKAPERKPIPQQENNFTKNAENISKSEGISQNSQQQTSSNQNYSQQALEAIAGAETIMVNGKPILKNPDSILVLVNKEHNLPSNWAPNDLVIPNIPFSFKENSPKKYMRKEAAKALEALFKQAQQDNIKLYGVSGYRSYQTQQVLFNNEVKQSGEEAAKKYVALPGQSEHETGLSIDVSSPSMNFLLKESLGDSKEGKWLEEHAKDFGFIIRYPKGKEAITGYNYEPWHIRYVGKEAAAFITANNITFDEYYKMIKK